MVKTNGAGRELAEIATEALRTGWMCQTDGRTKVHLPIPRLRSWWETLHWSYTTHAFVPVILAYMVLRNQSG